MHEIAYGLAIGFALGSIPFAWLLHRFATGRDLRREGSGNPGATNVQRSAGTMWGIAALLLDGGKGALAVALATRTFGDRAAIAAALGSVLGHVFSPWLSGRGGKGVATGAGAFAVLAPLATAVSAAVFALAVVVTSYVAAGSAAAALAMPVAIAVLGPRGDRKAAVITAAAIAMLIAWRHRENFERMRAGTEPHAGD